MLLWMRPIFSESRHGADCEHSIGWWIGKWGVERAIIRIESSP